MDFSTTFYLALELYLLKYVMFLQQYINHKSLETEREEISTYLTLQFMYRYSIKREVGETHSTCRLFATSEP